MIVDILFHVLEENHGAINISGWYPVPSEAMDDIGAILKDRLFQGQGGRLRWWISTV